MRLRNGTLLIVCALAMALCASFGLLVSYAWLRLASGARPEPLQKNA